MNINKLASNLIKISFPISEIYKISELSLSYRTILLSGKTSKVLETFDVDECSHNHFYLVCIYTISRNTTDGLYH